MINTRAPDGANKNLYRTNLKCVKVQEPFGAKMRVSPDLKEVPWMEKTFLFKPGQLGSVAQSSLANLMIMVTMVGWSVHCWFGYHGWSISQVSFPACRSSQHRSNHGSRISGVECHVSWYNAIPMAIKIRLKIRKNCSFWLIRHS